MPFRRAAAGARDNDRATVPLSVKQGINIALGEITEPDSRQTQAWPDGKLPHCPYALKLPLPLCGDDGADGPNL